MIAVQRWTRQYEEWKAWFARWHNRVEPGFLSPRPRRQRPEPPAWMAGACSSLVEDGGALADGCRAWQEWQRHDYLSLVRASQVTQARDDLEKPEKTVWWEHVHLDALWPMTQSGASAFGVLGAHVTLNVSKRVQVFLAPGAILMRLPTGDGSQTWSVATDWGFSYRIFDFKLPGMGRPATLHLNFARVWVLGTNLPVERELYLAGFSLTFKQRPGASGRK